MIASHTKAVCYAMLARWPREPKNTIQMYLGMGMGLDDIYDVCFTRISPNVLPEE